MNFSHENYWHIDMEATCWHVKCDPIRRLSVDNYGVGSRSYINNYRARATNGERAAPVRGLPTHTSTGAHYNSIKRLLLRMFSNISFQLLFYCKSLIHAFSSKFDLLVHILVK